MNFSHAADTRLLTSERGRPLRGCAPWGAGPGSLPGAGAPPAALTGAAGRGSAATCAPGRQLTYPGPRGSVAATRRQMHQQQRQQERASPRAAPGPRHHRPSGRRGSAATGGGCPGRCGGAGATAAGSPPRPWGCPL